MPSIASASIHSFMVLTIRGNLACQLRARLLAVIPFFTTCPMSYNSQQLRLHSPPGSVDNLDITLHDLEPNTFVTQ